MSRALFLVLAPHEMNLPALDALRFETEGAVFGGWWVAPGTEPQGGTVMVVVEATDEMLDAMAADTSKYLYLEDVSDEA